MNSISAGIGLIQKGGFVMYPLLIAALVALTIIFERIYVFLKVYKTSPDFITQTLKQIRNQEFSQAISSCNQLNTPVASILSSGVEHFDNPVEEMELCMKNKAESWVPILEKRVEVLDTIITAAPLMGLLGTITGMMSSFEVLSEKGVNEPNAITGGVAEALIATATGLIIALFCLLAYNYLTSKIKVFIYEIEAVASQLVEIRLAAHRNRKQSIKNSSSGIRLMKIRQRPIKKARIEIIPMIDVIFFLLVFFMISSLAMTRINSMPVALPKTSEAPQAIKQSVILTVKKDGSIFINKTPVNLSTLRSQLVYEMRDNPQDVVVVNADQGTQYGLVVQVMDLARQTGVRKFALATEAEGKRNSK